MTEQEQRPQQKPRSGIRLKLHEVIFESDTPAGKAFDIGLIWAILISLAVVMLESMPEVKMNYASLLITLEWIFTILFTLEIILRLIAVREPFKYLFSFYGIVDLLAVAPTYLGLIIPGAQGLVAVRTFRLLRVFRIFKLSHYLGEADVLYHALRTARPKITVFLIAVFATVISAGAIMHLVEGAENGFTSIPRGIYWAIVTMTTVGYGDISPHTPLGQFLASCLMIFGYGIIAIPTGIVTSELTRSRTPMPVSGQACPACGKQGHEVDAKFCKHCGSKIHL